MLSFRGVEVTALSCSALTVRPVFSFWVDQLWVYRKTQKSKKMFFSFRVGLLFGFVGELSTNLWPFWRGLWRAFQPPLFGEGFTAKCPVACLLTMALYPAEEAGQRPERVSHPCQRCGSQ